MSFDYTPFLSADDGAATAVIDELVLPHSLDVTVSPTVLRGLESILTGEPVEDLPDLLENPMVVADSMEQMISRISDALIDALTTVDDARIPDVAEQWYDSDEVVSEGWAAEDVEETLTKLRGFARRCRQLNQNMYLWMSL